MAKSSDPAASELFPLVYGELRKVAPVGGDGMGREVAFEREVRSERIDQAGLGRGKLVVGVHMVLSALGDPVGSGEATGSPCLSTARCACKLPG